MIWYPYEQLKTMKAPYEIVDANGVYLYTKDQKLIDSVSSWWSVIHGYKHPVINQAIISQVEKFSHVMLGGLTHEPARRLSEKLASWLPGDLDYCFFSDSGSVAVEVALKMALQYYMNRGDEKRTMILALEHAYHGDTFKTMEAGDDEDYHFVLKAYGASPYVVHIPTEIPALEKAFEQYHDKLNCVLVECGCTIFHLWRRQENSVINMACCWFLMRWQPDLAEPETALWQIGCFRIFWSSERH